MNIWILYFGNGFDWIFFKNFYGIFFWSKRSLYNKKYDGGVTDRKIQLIVFTFLISFLIFSSFSLLYFTIFKIFQISIRSPKLHKTVRSNFSIYKDHAHPKKFILLLTSCWIGNWFLRFYLNLCKGDFLIFDLIKSKLMKSIFRKIKKS